MIIHRDVKCANILTTTEANIKISDFGAAKQLSKSVREAKFEGNRDCKSFKGSPFWLAPEVALKIGHSYPVDIWSLGCCALEMLTGRSPWSDVTIDRNEVINLIKDPKQYPNYPEHISAECYDFIFHCCIVRNPQ